MESLVKHIRENTRVKKARGNKPQERLVNHPCITYHARDTWYVTTEILPSNDDDDDDGDDNEWWMMCDA